MWISVTVIVFAVAAYLGITNAGFIRKMIAHDGAEEHAEHEQTQWYTCGMHPWVIMPKPGLCPICHMDLTPIDPEKFTGEIAIDPVVVQNIGVRVADIETGPLTMSIRTVGSVTYDERLVRDINVKVGGWIEKVHVGYEGAKVRAGDPLFELYSPELYGAQEEYLLALRSRSISDGAQRLLDAARTKLLFYDVTEEQIAALEKSGKPAKTMTISSPHDGIVIAKHANEGMRTDPGMQVYRIADLSRVWVMATLYEHQLPYVQTGQTASMTLPYIPGQRFEGQVIYIYPYLDAGTRQVNVRLEFDNSAGTLKPGMFASVMLESTLRQNAVLAPSEALIRTGERTMAFVSLGEGRFEPRNVMIGLETDGNRVQILDGLKPGERVVVSGQFLIDSEARLRESLARMVKGDLASEQRATYAMAGSSELKSLPPKVAELIGRTLNDYLAIAESLTRDSTDGIADHAGSLATALDGLVRVNIAGDAHFWHRHDEAVTAGGKAMELAASGDLATAREKFGDISISLRKLLMATGIPQDYGREIHTLRCPMYRAGQGGAYWLQPAGPVRNPYMGSVMIECFNSRETLPITNEGVAP